MAAEEARRNINSVVSSLSDMDTSFADDEVILISSTLDMQSYDEDVFESVGISDSTINLTDSISDNADAIMEMPAPETPLTNSYNGCGKRFERGLGDGYIKNDVISFKPVSNFIASKSFNKGYIGY